MEHDHPVHLCRCGLVHRTVFQTELVWIFRYAADDIDLCEHHCPVDIDMALVCVEEIRLSIWKAAIDMLPFLFIAAVTMTVTYFSTTFISNIYLLLVSRIIMAAVLYMAILWMLHANILRECINWLSRKERVNKEFRKKKLGIVYG